MASPNASDVARRLLILKYQIVVTLAIPPKEIMEQAIQRWSKTEVEDFRAKLNEKASDLCAALKHLGLWDFLTPSELIYFTTHPLDLSHRQMVNASWRMEAAAVLMWALRLIPEWLSYDEPAKPDLLKQVPSDNASRFIAEASLISSTQIEDKQSLAEVWHWRSRTRELSEREDLPKPGPSRSFDEFVRSAATRCHKKGDLPLIIEDDFPVRGKAYRDLSKDEWSCVRSIAIERHFATNWLCGFAPDNNWDETPTDT